MSIAGAEKDRAGVPLALRVILAGIVALLVFTMLAVAADDDLPSNFERWNETATRAEAAVDEGRASLRAFETLRDELAVQRAEADRQANAGGIVVRSLKARLRALGAKPVEGETEPGYIARIRSDLEEQLGEVEGPIIAAQQAATRANVLIEEIDRLIRTRAATDLFERKPSPLFPATWLTAAVELGDYIERIKADTRLRIQLHGASYSYLTSALLPALGLLIAGTFLLIGTHFLLLVLERRLDRDMRRRQFLLKAAGIHVLRFVLSLVAIILIVLSVSFLNLGQNAAANLATAAMGCGITLFLINWLANVLLAPARSPMRLVPLNEQQARRGYWLAMAFGVVLCFDTLADGAAGDYRFSPASLSALGSLVILGGALVLQQLTRLFLSIAASMEDDGGADENALAADMMRLAGRIMQAIALAAVIAAALGYVTVAREALSPIMATFALLGFAYLLHQVLLIPVRFLLGEGTPSTALTSVLVASALLLATLPLIALAWGTRLADLTEAWRYIRSGVEIGGVQLSPSIVLILVATFLIGVFVTRWVQRLVERLILPRTRIDTGGRNAIRTGLGYVGITASALLAISMAGLDLSNLALIAGALSVGVGFGMQAVISNFVSGIILLIERPIKEGDWIEVSGFSGFVRKISVRSTRIETFDRHDVIIPNADLIAGTVKNMTLSSQIGRLIVQVGVAYGSDVEQVRDIMLKAASTHQGVLSYPPPAVLFMRMGDSALEFELRCFLKDVSDVLSAHSDMLYTLYAEFRTAGIEIPFPQRDVSLRNLDQVVSALKRQPAAKS